MDNLVPVQQLAVALGLTVPEVLQRADDIIERRFREGGIEAASGYSTRTHKQLAYVTPLLAEELRRGRTSG